MNRKVTLGLVIAVVFQFLVLTGMYVSAALPLWTGNEIKLKTIPVDPRSMFRGNYARLRYDISEIESSHVPDSADLRNGEIVYIKLRQDTDGLYVFDNVSLETPRDATYLRGRIQNRRYEKDASYIRVKYGIEAFFAAKEKALALEKNLRTSGVAVLMVSNSGKARLKDVIARQP